MSKKYLFSIVLMLIIIMSSIVIRGNKLNNINTKKNQEKLENEDQEVEEYTIDIIREYDEAPTYPPGKVEDIYNKFDYYIWLAVPEENIYDPDNRIAKNGVYGRVANGRRDQILKDMWAIEDEKYEYLSDELKSSVTKLSDLPEEYKGKGKFPIECLKNQGEEFTIEEYGFLGKVSNVHSVTDISELDMDYRYFSCDMEEFKAALNNPEKCVVMADIWMKGTTEWIEESEVVPRIIYANRKEKYFEVYSGFYKKNEDGEENEKPWNYEPSDKYPEYYNLGLYDQNDKSEDVNVYVCSLRKEDVIEFSVAYIIEKEKLDNAYLYYGENYEISNDYYYKYGTIIPIKLEQ